MNKKFQYIFAILFSVLLIGLVFSYQIWRVKQFQKATQMGFIKAWFVLGK
jgi:hypothetical protein